jgi:hypothetical protein
MTGSFYATVILRGKRFRCQARQLSPVGTFLATSHKELDGNDLQVELISQSPNPVHLSGTVVFAIPIGSEIELELSFRSLNLVLLSGTAIYAIPSGIGIRIGEDSAEHRQILQTFLHAHGFGLAERMSS